MEVGAGVTGALFTAPYASSPPAVPATFSTLRLGARYAVTNTIEVVASGFFDPAVTLAHNGVTVNTDDRGYLGNEHGRGTFVGTLTYGASRLGGTAGVRVHNGMTLRWVAGLEAGWSLASQRDFQHLDDNGRNYGLTFNDITTGAFLIAPTAGVEWVGGDKWSISVLPRAEILLGSTPTVAVSVPLLFSWSWYL